MKKFTFTFLLLLTGHISHTQITFQRTFGGIGDEYGYYVEQTTDGGYIMAGFTNSFGAGARDVFIVKAEENGNPIWIKSIGGVDDDFGYSIQQTSDGGYIIAGDTDQGFYKIYLIKTDSSGNLLWTKKYGGSNNDYGSSVQQTTDGGYIIAGTTSSYGAGNKDFYLIKSDPNGDTLWTKTFGGTGIDKCNFVQQTTDGGYILAGFTYSFGAGNTDAFIVKTNDSGNLLWSKTYGGTLEDDALAVRQTTDGGYIITGFTRSFGAGNSDAYLIKTDANGDTLWTKTFGGPTNDSGNSVQQTTDGGYMVAGWASNLGPGSTNAYLIKTDLNGDTLWTRNFGSSNSASGFSAQQTSDGGYILAGYAYGFGPGTGALDAYLVKTDGLGISGCYEGSTATIVSTPAPQVTIPATIESSGGIVGTPVAIVGSGGISNTLCTSVGINEIIADNLFILFPNPTEGNFITSFEGTIMKGNIEILNVLGENVFSESILNESKKEISLKSISAGIYFVKVFDGEKYYCKKVIIEHN